MSREKERVSTEMKSKRDQKRKSATTVFLQDLLFFFELL